MLLIDDKVVSLDVIEKFFCCDIDKCLGQCCIEGDAGAPLEPDEVAELEKAVPVIWNDLTPGGQRAIKQNGVTYTDADGDLVTTLADGAACAFATFAKGGKCLCAIDKAYREGRLDFPKPISCALYPIRVTKYPTFTAVNYHKWKICSAAEVTGRKCDCRVYQLLREPLIRAFGQKWYDELAMAASEYLKSNIRENKD